ncbi:MAG: exported protein of unknown function [Nitrospira sp.]|nr:exported protein of unknown function [Nitrospira sp.]
MKVRMSPAVIAVIVLGVCLFMPTRAVIADSGHTETGHKKLAGTVVKKAGLPTVKTSDGASYQLSDKIATKFGVEPFNEGEEVMITLDENNAIIDVHRKGEKSKHRFVTGKLVHVGVMKPEIKMQTEDGEKVFPLLHQETKTKPLPNGTMITVELNEAGAVVDLHRADDPGKNK